MNALLYIYVCASNLYGLRILSYENEPILKLFVIYAVFASFVMHVYEIERFTKDLHISVLKKDTFYNYLVLMDKLFAWTLIFLYSYYKHNVVKNYIPHSIAAIILCIISTEISLTKNNNTWFAILHGTWHLVAFHLGMKFSSFEIR